MEQFVRQILIYVVLVSLIRSLVMRESYRQYLQFFGSVILILLMLTPMLQIFGGEKDWYAILEKNLLKMDIGRMENQLQAADGNLKKIVQKEYEETLALQVAQMAKEDGLSVKDTQVTLKEAKDGLCVSNISLTCIEGEEKEEEGQIESVETIYIGKKDEGTQKRAAGKKVNRFQNRLCNYYGISKKQVEIWE